MALDDVRTVGEQKDGLNKGDGAEERKDKSFADSFLETFSSFGNSVRGFCVETGNTLKGCAYPVKEKVVKVYDDVVSTFKTKGTRNKHAFKNNKSGNRGFPKPRRTNFKALKFEASLGRIFFKVKNLDNFQGSNGSVGSADSANEFPM